MSDAVEGGQRYKVFNGLGIVTKDFGSYISMWPFYREFFVSTFSTGVFNRGA